MKIQSHELITQTQHSYSRVELETQMSFSTFYTDSEVQSPQTDELTNTLTQPQELETKSPIDCYFSDTYRTIDEIIQNLLKMLKERSNDMSKTDNSKLFGYTHLSLMQRYEEHESLDFSTIGHIQTDKGSLDIDINFSMSRSFIIQNNIDIYSSVDPLVINMDGDIPNLTTDTFSFDLDNDGESDQISTLGSGSGFLALDKNDDGIINSGSELFGTLTGDGFSELGSYDEDANHWIDENDSIFDRLRIWFKNDDKREKELVGLGEVGIGAIYLNSEMSEFSYKTSSNQLLGEMKSCGMFLNENGSCGTISQIDFASREKDDEKSMLDLKFKESEQKSNNSEMKPLAELLQA